MNRLEIARLENDPNFADAAFSLSNLEAADNGDATWRLRLL